MTIDYIIVIVYLAVIVLIGLITTGKVKSIRDFSLSNNRYGVFALLATLSASFIGGGFSTGNASKVAQFGIGNIIALCGFSISIILVGSLIAPRMTKFQKAISTGEIMGMSYGKPARIFTGIFGMLVCAGILGAQVGAIGYIFNIFLGLPNIYGILIGCGIVILYSTFGGMKAVVATDIIQFVVLGISMPVLLILSISATGGVDNLVARTDPAFFNIFNGYSITGFISLFLTLALGEILVPPYTQRLLMGRDLKTTAKATVWSGIISVPFFIITGMIGLVGAVYFTGTATDANSIMQSMVKAIAPVGVRGIIIAGMLSIVMSSADSFLNSASVSLVNDVIIPLRKKEDKPKRDLMMTRLINLGTGVLAVLFAVLIPNVLDVLLFSYNFWCPVILVPLAAALLGFKTKPAAFYACMTTGILVMLVWSYVLGNPWDFDGTIAGFVANLIVFVSVTKFSKSEGLKANA